MACFRPLKGYYDPNGRVVFKGAALHPDAVKLPCGQCIGCHLEQKRQWAIRCTHEAEVHPLTPYEIARHLERRTSKKEKPIALNSYVTFTYADKHLPENESLDVTHWQTFAKALRNKYGRFRFFHSGEYGDSFERMHLHALIYGIDFSHDRKPLKQSGKYTLYKSESLDELWGNGYCQIGAVSPSSAAYVCNYIMKKINGAKAASHYQGKKPEYSTMSRRPGIGYYWYRKNKKNVYPRDEIIVDGRKVRPPSAYDRFLEKDEPKTLERIKEKRICNAEKHSENNTSRRLEIREICTAARAHQNDP